MKTVSDSSMRLAYMPQRDYFQPKLFCCFQLVTNTAYCCCLDNASLNHRISDKYFPDNLSILTPFISLYWSDFHVLRMVKKASRVFNTSITFNKIKVFFVLHKDIYRDSLYS